MMTEEVDYMSDNFITTTEASDVRPGLIHDRKRKREIQLSEKKKVTDERHKTKYLSKGALAFDQLQKGLEKPISADNKGFKMLQKMGFSPGSSVGVRNVGPTEPIQVTLKNDRAGLGLKVALKEIEQRKELYRRSLIEKHSNVDDYRNTMCKRAKEKEMNTYLLKSARTCYQLDSQNGVKQPREQWFWPDDCQPNVDSDSDEEMILDEFEYDIQTKLETLTLYLRGTYYYCVWCGVAYDDEKDILNSCPGTKEEDH